MSKDEYKYTPIEQRAEEEREVYRSFSSWQHVVRFFAMRFAWLFVACLALIILPLVALKSLISLGIGALRNTIGVLFYKTVNPEYFYKARDSLLGCLSLGFIAIASLFGFLKPSIPGWLVKKSILLATETYKWSKKPKMSDRIPHNVIDVKTPDETVDTIEFRSQETALAPYQIIFLANGVFYEHQIARIFDLQKFTKAHTRVMNYPGVKIYNHQNVHEEPKEWWAWFKKKFRQEIPESFDEVVNAGIAQVYSLKRENSWDWGKVEEQVHLYGHSLGGGVAAQVREHFIKNHQIKLKTFSDRSYDSFADVAAAQLTIYCGIPFVLAKGLSLLILYGAGDWNHDTLDSLKKYGGENFNYVNLVLPDKLVISTWDKVKNFFGLGEMLLADDILPDSTTLMVRIEEEAASSKSTTRILGDLAERKKHAVVYGGDYSDSSHQEMLSTLFVAEQHSRSAINLYTANWFLSASRPLASTAAADCKDESVWHSRGRTFSRTDGD